MVSELISIIVPVYNAENFVSMCIDSILNQSYRNIELLLINDGSNDKSGEICDKYAERDKRIKVIHQNNMGVSAARNRGVETSSGEWIIFVDADDWIENDYLEDCSKYFNDELDIIFVNEIASERKYDTKKQYKQLKKRDIDIFSKCLLNKYIVKEKPHLSSPCSKVYRKNILKEYNIKFNVELRKSEDALFNQYYYYYAENGLWIKKGYYHYRVNRNSVTHKYDSKAAINYEKYFLCLEDFFGEKKIHDQYIGELQYRKVYNLFYCLAGNYCHPQNPERYNKRKNDFFELLNSELYRTIDFEGIFLHGKDKLLLLLIKKRFFFCINVIMYLYNIFRSM